MILSDKKALHSIDKNITRLCRLGESCLFVSQYKEWDRKRACIIIKCPGNKDDENDLLPLRRLLSALQYRLAEDCGVNLQFTISKEKEN